jgi:hypothetical protein
MEPTVEQMKQELAKKDDSGSPTRVQVNATGPGGVTAIKVPRHMLEGSRKLGKSGTMTGVPGMLDINKARAKVYGSENRPPLNIGQIGRIHKNALDEHFQKPLHEQMAAEDAALGRLRAAQHIGATANTLDKSEKLDTVNHEHDEQGRTYIGFASKGVAGHALYSSGEGKNQKYHVVNTCPGQTAGCGGGHENGVVDTMKGTCFAPNAEAQYPAAAVRRASHEQAKHDPAMTQDWILAHTGSLRNAARLADRSNKRLLFRPNVVDETDVSSRHVIKHLNRQRAAEGKPPITANSYGKTNEMHDPANGYYVTHSNIGPKVKKGAEIQENIDRDKQRISRTIHAATASGKDFVNDEGEKTPPKNSYMVTDVKRHSPFDKKMQGAITHAKYWSTGREPHELDKEEREEGPEGHFGPNGKPTTPDKAHFGHETHDGLRFDYQKQHILHPRLVQVGKNEDGTPHMIPTDSRFKDDEFLPKNRFKTKNGKVAGAIVMTTPTESTSNVGHQTSFTHHVGEHHIEHAKQNNGEYQIDTPQEQIAAKGKEYVTPQPIKFMKRLATGGPVGNDIDNEEFDGHMAFPEQSFAAQHRLAHRHDPEEVDEIGVRPYLAGAKHIRSMAGQHKAFQKPEPRRMADGGEVKAEPSQDEMLAHVMLRNMISLKDVGANEAPNLKVKEYVPPGTGPGMPIGGVDFQPEMPGQQVLPGQPAAPMGAMPPQLGQPAGQVPPTGQPQGQPPAPAPGAPRSNILQMTQQGQALAAMRPNQPMPRMAGGGSIKELEEYIRQHKGGYGARRVQRAADEIPNLEDLYTLEALKHAFSGDNAQAMMTMDPAHFEQYASPIPERTKRWPGEESNKENLPTADYIRYLQSVGRFHDVPMLQLNKEEAGLPLTPFISGHEGRHRSRAMAQAGQKKGLVRMLPRSELREPFPRRSQEDYIEAMKKELAMTKGLVLPQRYSESKDEGWTETPVRRPAVKMPDIYAEGGTVKDYIRITERPL